MILDNYQLFIRSLLSKLQELGIDVSNLVMDHIGYQASSDEDYDKLCLEFDKLGEKVRESIVGGRRVGIYKLNQPLHYRQYINPAVELVAPKSGQVCPSALEHVEFVIDSFGSFMKKYPDVNWDITDISQPDFPMIKLKLSDYTQVKFHLTPVLQIVESIKDRIGKYI